MAENPFLKYKTQGPISPTKSVTAPSQVGGVKENPFLKYKTTTSEKPKPFVENVVEKYRDAIAPVAKVYTDSVKAIPGGLYNAGREFTRTAGMLGGAVGNLTGNEDVKSRYKEQMKRLDMIPRYENKDQGVIADVVQTAAEWAPGMVFGDKGASKLLSALPATGSKNLVKGLEKTLAYMFRSAGASAGGAMVTANPDEETLLVRRDDSGSSPLVGFGIDPKTGKVADDDLFSRKATLLYDSLVTGGVIDAGVMTVKAGIDILAKPIFGGFLVGFNKTARENDVGGTVLKAIADINPTDTREVQLSKMKEVAEYVRTNKDYFIDFNSVDGSIESVKGTKSTLEIMGDKAKENKNYYDELADLQNAAKSHKGPQLDAALSKSSTQASNAMDQQIEGLGKQGSMDSAVTGINKHFEDKLVRPKEEALGTLKSYELDLREQVKGLINNNPIFTKLVASLKDTTDSNVIKQVNENTASLVDDIFELQDVMSGKRDKYFNDFKSLGVTGDASLPQKVINDLANNNISIPKETIKAIDDLGPNPDLGKMEELAVTNVQILIEEAVAPTKKALLITLKDSLMKDQINRLRDIPKGTKGVVGARKAVTTFDKAMKFFKEDYATWYNNPILDNIRQAKKQISEVRQKSSSQNILANSLSDSGVVVGSSTVTDDFLEFLNKHMDKDKNVNERVFDVALSDWGRDLKSVMNTEGPLKSQEVLGLSTKLEKWGPVLQKADPVKYQQLNEMFQGIKSGLLSSDEILERVTLAKEELGDASAAVYGFYAKEFNQRIGNNYHKVPDSYEAFTELFTGKQNGKRIEEMVKAVSGNPDMKYGIELAFAKHLKDSLTGKGVAKTGSKNLNDTALQEFLNPDALINKYGREILGDRKMTLFEAVVERAYNDAYRLGNDQNQLIQEGGIFNQLKNAANKVITLAFGVLDPTAARIRVFTSQYLDTKNPTSNVRQIMDNIFADPDYFLMIADRVIKKGTPFLNARQKEHFQKIVRRGVFYNSSGEEEDKSNNSNNNNNIK